MESGFKTENSVELRLHQISKMQSYMSHFHLKVYTLNSKVYTFFSKVYELNSVIKLITERIQI